MSSNRPCSKQMCSRPAVATLTYVYADSMAVLGPLSAKAEPHSYDLCEVHSERLSAPQGWSVLRISPPPEGLPTAPDRPRNPLFGG